MATISQALSKRMQIDSRLLGLLGLGTLKSTNQRAGTSINQSDCGSAGSRHPQISQSESLNHYQPIRFWFRWILAPSNQPIIELGPLSTNQILDPPGLSTSVGLEANPTSPTVKIASPWVYRINSLRYGQSEDCSD